MPLPPEDRAQITELFARYAVAYDERRLDVLRSCFTNDASYQAQLQTQVMATFKSAEAIIAGIASVMAEQGDAQRRHFITNLILEPQAPGTVAAMAYAAVGVIDDGGPTLGAMAIYRADVERSQMAWQFSRMVVGMDGYAGRAPRR